MKKKLIILMGGQGVGKGTCAAELRNSGDYDYIEMGAMFRALPADSEIAKIIARGELVPDDKVFELVESKISGTRDIIMDGLPRTLDQAKWLVENLADKFDIQIIYMDVPEEIMKARIQKRINEGGGRADDADAAAVRRRLDTFWNVTMPAIKWLQTAPGIHFATIDATGTVPENMAAINAVLGL